MWLGAIVAAPYLQLGASTAGAAEESTAGISESAEAPDTSRKNDSVAAMATLQANAADGRPRNALIKGNIATP
jgi:hypothetical protein